MEATDGRIGAVKDILLNQYGWCVCHVMVDLTDPITGKYVVSPPDAFGQPDVKDTSFPVSVSPVRNLRTGRLLKLMKLSIENMLMYCVLITAGNRAGDVRQ